jgi:hypothetical protein
MTEDELNAVVESKLKARVAARLQADREAVRIEVIREIRREADREWYDRVNKRHAVEGSGDPVFEAQRRKLMDERAAQSMREMDIANARPVDGAVMRGPRASLAGGGSGFTVKRPV